MSPLSRFALSSLAAAGVAFAQTPTGCSNSGTTTIENAAQATQLARCSTFSGSIAVATGVAEAIRFDGQLKTVTGDLIVTSNQNIKAIGATNIEEIGGFANISNNPALEDVSFAKLKKVKRIQLVALPKLEFLGFTAEINEADEVRIENTGLTSLKGLNLTSVGTFFLAANPKVQELDMKLTNVTTLLELSYNNEFVNVSLPFLAEAGNITLRNCSSAELPSLVKTRGRLGLYGNGMRSFAAPNLTDVEGALAIVSNTELANLSLPLLKNVREVVQIANNTKLQKIELPSLEAVRGAFDFNGNFSEVSTPKLGLVKGAFNLQSTGDVQGTCDSFYKPLSSQRKIEGGYTCVGKAINPGGEGTKPSTTGSGAKKTGAASAVNFVPEALFAGLAAAFFL